jgi:mannitol 2-dehydrogenase
MVARGKPAPDLFLHAAAAMGYAPAAWLSMRDIYGGTADAPAFRDAFAGWLRALWADGTAATLRRYLDGAM